VALRGVMQTIGFAERLAQATAPARYALYEKRKRAAGRRLGIDVDRDLIGQFTGDTFASFGVDGRWALRNEVRDPAALRALLVRIADAGALGTWKVARLNGGGDLYAVLGDGGVPFTMGMIGRSFVLARDPAAAGELAAAKPAPVPGAKGALALSADGEAIAGQLLQRFAAVGGMASYLTAPIGDLRGWSSATRSHVELKIH
jgi:hypothetical protein